MEATFGPRRLKRVRRACARALNAPVDIELIQFEKSGATWMIP